MMPEPLRPSPMVGETRRLPAHRQPAERRKKDAKKDDVRVWAFDIDETITAAPGQYARLSEALHAVGDRVVCVTGHGPVESREELLDAIGFKADEIIIADPGKSGKGKAEVLAELGAFFCFEDSIEYGPEIVKVCPVTFQYREPHGDKKPKKSAKKAAKLLKAGKSQAH